MSECPACADAAARASHMFTLGCRGCTARAVARSPQCFDARTAAKDDPAGASKRDDYRNLLAKFGLKHNEVLAAMRADVLSNAKE